ncbi:MAG: chemotaxis protein CheC [Elusimicrobia bacterium]|nr:chemotaxis protein CheC [Elusimicrobiota bacterium]
MSLPPPESLTKHEQDYFQKLIEASVETSMQSMAKLTQRDWSITSVGLTDGHTQDFLKIFESQQGVHSGVQLWSKGSYPLLFLLLFSPKSSAALTAALSSIYQLELSEAALSRKLVLEEVGNIIISSFLKRLANTLKQTILTTTPAYLEGSKKELLTATMASLGGRKGTGEHAVMVHIGMSSASLSADCDLMILADPACLRQLVMECSGQ